MEKVKFRIFKTLCFALKTHPKYIFVSIFSILVVVGTTIFASISLSLIIDALTTKAYSEALRLALNVTGASILLLFLNFLANNLKMAELNILVRKVNLAFSLKMTKVSFANLETAKFQELKEKVDYVIRNQSSITVIVYNLLDFIYNIVVIISLFAVIITFEPILLAIIGVGALISIGLTMLMYKVQAKMFAEIIPINRYFSYYFSLLLDSRYAKDFRLYPIGDYVVDQFDIFLRKSGTVFVKTMARTGYVNGAINLFQVLEMSLIYIVVAVSTIVNNLAAASFSLLVASATTVMSSFERLTASTIQLFRYSTYLNDVLLLWKAPEETNFGSQVLEGIETLEFKNVCFTYPNTTNEILHNISFKISNQEKISLVGLNGAGKTTIIKLICRFYEPNSGQILINGIDIRDYDIKSYRNAMSTVFQDYRLFYYSIGENIISNQEFDEAKVNECLEEVEMTKVVSNLKSGINTNLDKKFFADSTDLSGGEKQKLAIARSLYRNSSLVILDEPTSALDPKSEAEIYENFNNLVRGKMTIYVSHRMSSSKFCDKILVINDGKVEAFKSHKELILEKDSLYYKLFMLQANNYEL